MKRYPFVLVCLLSVIVAFVIAAQMEKAPQGLVTAFTNVRLIDGTGGEPAEVGSLVMAEGKIIAVGSAGEVKIPEGAVTVDLPGKTIMPALIAGHSHLGLVKGTKAASANVTEENVRKQIAKYEAYGIGTVVSLGADGDFIYDLRDERRKNVDAGPAVLTAGLGFGATGGVPPVAAGLDQVHRPANAEEASAQVEALAMKQPDFVKIWIDDAGGTLPVRMTREVRRAIIQEAKRNGLKVAAHVYYLEDAKELVREGVDVLAHSIRDLPVDDDLIAAMKERGTAYIPTLFLDEAFFVYADQPEWVNGDFFRNAIDPEAADLFSPGNFKERPGAREVLKRASENLKRLHEAGIPIGLGTDSGATPLRVQGFGEHRELQLYVAAGISPLDAIHYATGGNARLTGESERTGTLEAGKQADFVVLGANPLEDIRNTEKIESVWIGGKKRR